MQCLWLLQEGATGVRGTEADGGLGYGSKRICEIDRR